MSVVVCVRILANIAVSTNPDNAPVKTIMTLANSSGSRSRQPKKVSKTILAGSIGKIRDRISRS